MDRLGLFLITVLFLVGIEGTAGAYVTHAGNGSKTTRYVSDSPVPTPMAVDCATCKTFMAETKQVLETAVGPKFDAELFEYFCKDKGDLSKLCKELLKTFFEKAREIILFVLTPSAFCPALKFCTADGGSLSSGHDVINDAPPDDPSKCENCKEFFGEVVKRLQDPVYEQPVVDLFKTICYAGCGDAKICMDAAEKYGKSLLFTLGSVMKKENLCPQIGACPPPTAKGEDSRNKTMVLSEYLGQLHSSFGILDVMNPDPSRISVHKNRGHQAASEPTQVYPKCDACRWYMNEYHAYLGTKVGEHLIATLTTDVCKTDVNVLRGLCEAVITSYRDNLLQIILEETQAAVICPLFDFCAAPSSNKTVVPTPPVPIGYKPSCDDCLGFVMKMQEAWKNTDTQVKLVKQFATKCVKICSFENTCQNFFYVNGPAVMTTVANEALEPQKTCKILKYCSEMPKKLGSRN
ncbi:uncharacterized protein LOC119726788 isoform X2 [Patiria miniata]|uniref:Saposin B-type domain-containing protein n=1 Tax=Patiria miniata TaxID=46514 RepID=A0A913ZTP8_PATMI|nr:uncharacterized protein LOC119726788 isoform X2 [Patiria miniata]